MQEPDHHHYRFIPGQVWRSHSTGPMISQSVHHPAPNFPRPHWISVRDPNTPATCIFFFKYRQLLLPALYPWASSAPNPLPLGKFCSQPSTLGQVLLPTLYPWASSAPNSLPLGKFYSQPSTIRQVLLPTLYPWASSAPNPLPLGKFCSQPSTLVLSTHFSQGDLFRTHWLKSPVMLLHPP